jgi:hypothetical protein
MAVLASTSPCIMPSAGPHLQLPVSSYCRLRKLDGVLLTALSLCGQHSHVRGAAQHHELTTAQHDGDGEARC